LNNAAKIIPKKGDDKENWNIKILRADITSKPVKKCNLAADVYAR
jgi:hypothetical protein